MNETAGFAPDDPRRRLAAAPMHWRQIAGVALCVVLNALDGFDVLSISFAAPGIAHEWGIDRGALGVVLSIEIFGMSVGSLLLGHLADRLGRRPIVLVCLAVMAAGMLATTQVGSIATLAATRLFTGFGIGGMLAVTNALAAEYANDRWRATAVAAMTIGYPLGVVIGGPIASALLASGGWRQVFALGAGMTALVLPLAPLLLPEPVGALLHRRRGDTLGAVNAALRRFGHAAITVLPPPDPAAPRTPIAALFSPRLRRVTGLLTAACFFHIMTFYFLIKWVPKIVADLGFSAAQAAGVLVWTNLGGVGGGLLFGLLGVRFRVRELLIGAMLVSVVAVALFGRAEHTLPALSTAAAIAGFCAEAGMVGLYALIAASFPTAVRAGGTGFVIGFGRAGAALGPIIAGFLFKAGLGLPVVTLAMGCGSLFGAIALLALRRAPLQPASSGQ